MKYAIVFPGQGSQSLGMLSDFADNFSIVKDTFTQASDALGFDLWQLTQEDQVIECLPAQQTYRRFVWRATAWASTPL